MPPICHLENLKTFHPLKLQISIKYLHFWNQCDLPVATCGLFGINLSLLSWPQLPMGNLVYSKQFDRGGSSQQTTLLTARRLGQYSVCPLSALSRRNENDTGPLSFNAKESYRMASQIILWCTKIVIVATFSQNSSVHPGYYWQYWPLCPWWKSAKVESAMIDSNFVLPIKFQY